MELKKRTLHKDATIEEYSGIPSTTPEKKKNSGKLIGILVAVAAVIVVCVIVLNGEAEKETAETAIVTTTPSPTVTPTPAATTTPTAIPTSTPTATPTPSPTTTQTVTPTPAPTWAPESDAIDSGSYCGVNWQITSNYELIIGDGTEQTLNIGNSSDEWPWDPYQDQISSVRFDGVVHAKGSIARIFENCGASTIDFNGFDTSEVTSMMGVFLHCQAHSLDLSSFDTRNVEITTDMFFDCQATSIDLSNFNSSKVYKMSGMFLGCQAKTLDLSVFDTSNVVDMMMMFDRCKIESLDLSSFDMHNVEYMEDFLYEATINQIKIGSNFRFNGYTPSGGTMDKQWIREDGSYGPMTMAELSEIYDSDPEKYAGTWVVVE